MAKIKKTITINAPVEEVFGFVSETSNLPSVWPSLTEIKAIHPLPNGGNLVRCVYNMAGVRFEVISEDIEWIANKRIAGKTRRGVQSTIVWDFNPEGDGTRLDFEVEYIVPIPLVSRLAEFIIARINKEDIEMMLGHLKARIEGIAVKQHSAGFVPHNQGEAEQ